MMGINLYVKNEVASVRDRILIIKGEAQNNLGTNLKFAILFDG
jgi:hypothetical protein